MAGVRWLYGVMATKRSTRCYRCPDPETHLVRTTGRVYRACATCAEDLALSIPELVRAVNVLPGAKPVERKPPKPKVWDEAAELLPENDFAAKITGMLKETVSA